MRFAQNGDIRTSARVTVHTFNPRPDGVWQVTRSDGGGAQRAPLRFSGTNIWVGKIQTALKDLIELYQT